MNSHQTTQKTSILCRIFGHQWFTGEEMFRPIRGEQCFRCGTTQNIKVLHDGKWKHWPRKVTT